MRTIGLIGGISWQSSAHYYTLINTLTAERLGGLHNAKSVMLTVDFAEVESLQRQSEDWAELAERMQQAARSVEAAGADFLVVCSNTIHRLAPAIEAAVQIPLLHIVDVTAAAIRARGMRKVGLLGTQYTMGSDETIGFYREGLAAPHRIEALVPEASDRDCVHGIIFEELAKGIVTEASRVAYCQVMQRLIDRGAEGIILGCTEIPMLIQQKHCAVPVFDTTALHAAAAVRWALG
jgi:aspartate racemase